jgi:hypothetical protein
LSAMYYLSEERFPASCRMGFGLFAKPAGRELAAMLAA